MPCWLHFCSIFGLRSLLDTHLYQKRGFSRNPLKTNEKSTFLTPRRLEHRPKIAPRRLQEVIFLLVNFHLDVGLILVPFWLPKCLPLGTLLALKIVQKNDPKMDCLKGRSKIAPRAPKTPPRRPPDPPRRAPGPPKRLPGAPRMAVSGCGCFWLWPLWLLAPNNSKSSRTCRKKEVDNGHPRWSLALATQKPKALSQLSEPRGWRRWSREALFNNSSFTQNPNPTSWCRAMTRKYKIND